MTRSQATGWGRLIRLGEFNASKAFHRSRDDRR